MYHTGELLKKREQDNLELVASNKSNLDQVSISTLFMDKAISNPLMNEGLITLRDLTNYSQLDLLKTPDLGKLRINFIIKELERHGLSLKKNQY